MPERSAPAHFVPRATAAGAGPWPSFNHFVAPGSQPANRVVVGAGFSGQGFKFAPGVGATLAGLALDAGHPVAPAFRLGR